MVDLRDVVDGTVGQGKADSHSDSGSEWSMDEADIESLLETRVALDLMDPHAAVDQALLQRLDNALEALRVPPLVRLDIHLHHTGKVTSAHVRTWMRGGPTVCAVLLTRRRAQLASKANQVLAHVIPLWEAAVLAVQQREAVLHTALMRLTAGEARLSPYVRLWWTVLCARCGSSSPHAAAEQCSRRFEDQTLRPQEENRTTEHGGWR